jgi:hypothetical protein
MTQNMMKVDEDSMRFFAYDANLQPLYVYLLTDYEDRMVLASRQKVSEDQLKAAINEYFEIDLAYHAKALAIDRKYPFWPERDMTEEENSAYTADWEKMGKHISLDVFLGRKFGMYPFVFEVTAFQRPDDWSERHTTAMHKEWEEDDKARKEWEAKNGPIGT